MLKYLIFFIGILSPSLIESIPHYYVTSADTEHFHLLLKLIQSILTHDPHAECILICDIGFTKSELSHLRTIPRVAIAWLPKRNPEIYTLHQCVHMGSRTHRVIRGSFSWKPVALKIALDIFPYVMYIDADFIVTHSMETIFNTIMLNGYYVEDTGHDIKSFLTTPVIQKIVNQLTPEQQAIVYAHTTHMLSAGYQGISRKYFESYVLPVYEYTTSIDLFKDDGSAERGFGAGRHDQTLFSIQAILAGIKVTK